MADEIDATDEREAVLLEAALKGISRTASAIPSGQPGECDLCGEEFSRVVETEKNGETVLACGRCRDKHGLK